MPIGDIVFSCYSSTTIDAIGVVMGEYEWHDEYDNLKRLRKVNWIVKDIQENIIYVSRGYGVKTQYGNELRITDFHFITDNPWQSAGKEIDITFKIRHTPEFTKGKLVQEGERQFRILSSENLQGIAPGQFGVVYDEAAQVCVGSGEIG